MFKENLFITIITRSCYQLILGPYLTAWCVSLRSFSSDNFQHRQLPQIDRYRDIHSGKIVQASEVIHRFIATALFRMVRR